MLIYYKLQLWPVNFGWVQNQNQYTLLIPKEIRGSISRSAPVDGQLWQSLNTLEAITCDVTKDSAVVTLCSCAYFHALAMGGIWGFGQ